MILQSKEKSSNKVHSNRSVKNCFFFVRNKFNTYLCKVRSYFQEILSCIKGDVLVYSESHQIGDSVASVASFSF